MMWQQLLTPTLKRLAKILLGRDLYIRVQHTVPRETHGFQYAAWTIYPLNLGPNSVVYSFGIGRDISFDRAIIDKYQLTVHAFDPTPQSIEWVCTQKLPSNFVLHTYGLADYNGMATFYAPPNPDYVSHSTVANKTSRAIKLPVRRLGSIIRELGHKKIDLLKMDIEGTEYAVIEDIVKQSLDISQILVEFHHRFEQVSVSQTKQAIETLNKHGYKIFAISPSGEEYSFIRV
jgi:FkbM family methyltransferase